MVIVFCRLLVGIWGWVFLVLVDLVTTGLWIWLIVGLLFAGLVWYCGLVIWWFRLVWFG